MTDKTEKIDGTMIVCFQGQLHIKTQTDLPFKEFEEKFVQAFLSRPESALKNMADTDFIYADASFIPTKPD